MSYTDPRPGVSPQAEKSPQPAHRSDSGVPDLPYCSNPNRRPVPEPVDRDPDSEDEVFIAEEKAWEASQFAPPGL